MRRLTFRRMRRRRIEHEEANIDSDEEKAEEDEEADIERDEEEADEA
jgi:hypothetical protein